MTWAAAWKPVRGTNEITMWILAALDGSSWCLHFSHLGHICFFINHWYFCPWLDLSLASMFSFYVRFLANFGQPRKLPKIKSPLNAKPRKSVTTHFPGFCRNLLLFSKFAPFKSPLLQMTVNSDQIPSLITEFRKSFFLSFHVFGPWRLTFSTRRWVCSVVSSAWERRRSDQSGRNLGGGADNKWRLDAATFRACIYIWSRCPNFDRQLWMSLPTAARMTHCRPDCVLRTQQLTAPEFVDTSFPLLYSCKSFKKKNVVRKKNSGIEIFL